jgi:asparagine synthase (glutamine-hydrolysing)
MCGIAGFASATPIQTAVITRMTTPIRHRGPDDEGYIVFSNPKNEPFVCGGLDTPTDVYNREWQYSPGHTIDSIDSNYVTLAFGHRRLSIVDLSPRGHQPMSYHGARYWITYNGEIYNHVELRTELEALGHRFSSNSDTEVLIASYAQWGEQCLRRLNGMWAFTIYDCAESTIFLSRDRFGVKPLYYWISPKGIFAFASEIKQFERVPGWSARINRQRAYDFLVFGLTDHTSETLFQGVFQLKPGHSITIDVTKIDELSPNSEVDSKRWYSLRPAQFTGTFEDACEAFKKLFVDSVMLRLRADVPVGSCLSGGLDSSSIVCVMNRLLTRQNANGIQKTFSACSDFEQFDERKWIEMVLNQTGVDAHYTYPSIEELFQESRKITWHQDEPFGSTSIYAQWEVFKLASRVGLKVMLDGQGADEQLAGYHGFFGARLAGLFKDLHWLELIREALAMRRYHSYSLLTSAKFLLNHLLPHSIADVLKRSSGHDHAKPAWLNLQALGVEPIDPKYLTGARDGNLTLLSISQVTRSGLQMLLHYEDRNSMAHSIESRVPFLDFRLVELVIGLPDQFKLARGVTKRVLRGAMAGILPEPIAQRVDKMGFVTPEEIWLCQRAPQHWRSMVIEAIDRAGGIIEGETFNQYLEKVIDGTVPFNFLPWRVVSFGQWLSSFNVSI